MENIDHRFSHGISDYAKRSKFFSRLAVFGAVELIWLMAGVLLAVAMVATGSPNWPREWDAAILALSGGILLPWAVTLLLEYAFRRTRPFQREGRGKALIEMAILTPSFPSGHATLAFAMAAVVAQLRPEMLPVFLCAAAIVAVSRVAVGVHFFSDVLVGAVIGWIVGGLGHLFGIAFLVGTGL